MRSLYFLACLCASVILFAEIKRDDVLTIGGYIEAYYSHDFNNPANQFRPLFIHKYNRTNEVNVNLAMIKLFLSHNDVKTIRNYTFRYVARSFDS